MRYAVMSLLLLVFMPGAPANAQLFSPYACPPGFRWGWDLHCHPAAFHPEHQWGAPHRFEEPRLRRR